MSPATSKPVILIGFGGHAGVVLDALRLGGAEVLGVCDPALLEGPSDMPLIEEESLTARYPAGTVVLANGIGMMPGSDKRIAAAAKLQALGYEFSTVRHPSAIVAATAMVGEGVHLMAGSIVQDGAAIGRQTIVNTGAQIDHGCRIGDFVHLCPGVILSGDVTVGKKAFIGAGAVVINGVRIGDGAVIGAGTVVTSDVPSGARIVTPNTRVLS